eukprot:762146-Hanusia_phi.AAC.4
MFNDSDVKIRAGQETRRSDRSWDSGLREKAGLLHGTDANVREGGESRFRLRTRTRRRRVKQRMKGNGGSEKGSAVRESRRKQPPQPPPPAWPPGTRQRRCEP